MGLTRKGHGNGVFVTIR